jgi:hypothetical protein
MSAPRAYPGRIRTDTTNAFAHHTLEVRVPAIVRDVLAREPSLPKAVADAVARLAAELESGAPLPPLAGDAAGAAEVRRALAERAGDGWLSTDWLFAETYAYRCLIERIEFWSLGVDPFRSNKHEEYAGPAHGEALAAALTRSHAAVEHDVRARDLLGGALFGNRIDLSFAASRNRGLTVVSDDLLIDEREATVRHLRDGTGPLHVVVDNAGTELTLDLVLVDFVLHELGVPVVLHVKTHPTFVSDATAADVYGFLGASRGALPVQRGLRVRDADAEVGAWAARLRRALEAGTLEVAEHPFWTGPESLWDLPAELVARFRNARLVLLKGDANYRRAVGDAVWPVDASFADVTTYFPAPLCALRTLKSDPIVGVSRERAALLDAADPTWRVNGRRGIACLGGSLGG